MRLLSLLLTSAAAFDAAMSWGSPAWNWGSANGKAHDEAAKLRGALATEAQRVDYLAAAKAGRISEASLKLALGLTMQRAGPARLPEPLQKTYGSLVAGGFEKQGLDGFAKLARTAAPAVDRYNLNVELAVKADRVAQFLECIRANAAGTLQEPRNLRYCWGESATEPGTFHFQESFVGKAGFEAHAAAPHFQAWEAFAGTDPFSREPAVQFYAPSTSLADDHPPAVVAAAVLASLDFATKGC